MKVRSADERRPRSSTADAVNVHFPAARPVRLNEYVPGSCAPDSSVVTEPSGPVRVAGGVYRGAQGLHRRTRIADRNRDFANLLPMSADPGIQDEQVVELIAAHVRLRHAAIDPLHEVPQMRRRGSHG